VKHKCGGIATVAVFLGLAAVLSVSLIDVFNRSQSIATEKKQTSSSGVLETITTNQSSVSNRPFMMAFGNIDGAYTVTSSYFNGTDSIPIILETCTPDHFKTITSFNPLYTSLGINLYKCLPLNQEYTLINDKTTLITK
jgi:hypothetical protein